ncbi:hypothetical protein B4923_16195 [Brenneria roseae subsp. americana]|uniref:HNH endonuclease n=1 Tax=Brenneria roseae subsp. americana TaxID=1508507 RepID=A0A2U1TML3_9GAMM|nr:hypothetical protein [Brenneria roseae]PWC10660.1 hypothetical protein B4923_16195 [Brenneria roseae subsp. americana]
MNLISRNEAISKGMAFYFTGKPCKWGGIAPRRVSNYQCTCSTCAQADLERSKGHYEKNKDHVLAYKKEWAERNEESIRQKRADYYQANSGHIKAKSKKYREENGQKARDCQRKCYEKNAAAVREKSKAYYHANKYSRRVVARSYYQRNKEVIKAASRRRSADKPDECRITAAAWRERNRERVREYQSRRRAVKRNAVPVWFGEWDAFVIQEAYALIKEREADTGIKWQVDHMIPLQAKKACGLHCASNIQVIPECLNLMKRNLMILTEPFQWAALAYKQEKPNGT